MTSTLDSILQRFPRERTWLLPALQAVQHARGWLSDEALAQVGAHLRVPASASRMAGTRRGWSRSTTKRTDSGVTISTRGAA